MNIRHYINKNNPFQYLLKWVVLTFIIGVLAGSVSAFFLFSLDYVTTLREGHKWIIAFLPLGGLAIGLIYHYWGKTVVKGNALIIDEFHNPTKVIPFRMTPFVILGTLVTHLFGGSAGREGTAIQMGASIADQFTRLFKLGAADRRIILVIGISAGFASVFGTPLAGAIFALEVFAIGKMRYEAILPAFLVAVIANYTCLLWGIVHTGYSIPLVPEMTFANLGWAILAGIAFGGTAILFSKSTSYIRNIFDGNIKYPPLRPFVGGVIIAAAVWAIGTTKYIGLGIPTIVESFETPLPQYDFLLKLLFTAFTLGVGFKGGEVTPLFFIGATLGNALSFFIPLPMALMAGMGFVAIFSGATNTPIACTIMGIELFGIDCGIFIGIACVVAYIFSGKSSLKLNFLSEE